MSNVFKGHDLQKDICVYIELYWYIEKNDTILKQSPLFAWLSNLWQGVISGKMSEFQGSSSQLFDPKGNNGALDRIRKVRFTV